MISEIKPDLIQDAIKEYYTNRNFNSSLEKIDEYINLNPRFIPFPYQFKVDILVDLNKIDEAFDVVNNGIALFPNSHDLLRRRSQIYGYFKNDFDAALRDIGNAILHFNVNSNSQQEQSLNSSVNMKQYLLRSGRNMTTMIDLKNFQQELKWKKENNDLKEDILGIKKDFYKKAKKLNDKIISERIKYIELLGIFTAILGFIFANTQKMTRYSSLTDALEFNIVFIIPIVTLLLFVKLFFK